MNKLNRLFLKGMCGALLMTGSLQATEFVQETQRIEETEEREVITPDDVMPKEERIALKEKRASLEGREIQEGGEKPLINEKEMVREEKISHGALYFSSHNSAWHNPVLFINDREKVQLHDGTIWKVNFWDRWKLKDWLVTDVIFLLPNYKLFYDYIMVNQRTGDYVDVNFSELEVLTFDPTYYGYRLWIIDIDDVQNLVYLNDGTVWSVPYSDDFILRHWQLGQVVVVGINDGAKSAIYPNILINFNNQNYSYANCIR